MTKKLLMGNEAMAHAALEAGVGVVAGYPGTPSSEIVETVARQYARGAAHGVHVEWSTNEKVALELLFGSSLAGARGLFTCKQMGLNVASDALMSLNYVSVRGGLVLIVADDPGPISSQTEQDTRRFAMFAKVPVLDPSSPEQAFHMVKAAFDLSEHFHTPVIVRPTTRVDHASAFFDVQEETFALPVIDGGFKRDPAKWVIFPRRAYEAHGEINARLSDMADVFSNEPTFASFNSVVEAGESFTGEPTFGIMAGGITAAYAREALRMIHDRAQQARIGVPAYRFMQVGTPYPFPEQAVSRFVSGLANVLVLEELDSVLEDQLAMLAGRTHASFNISGRATGEMRDRGENDVDDITTRIERFLGLTGRLSLHRLRGGEQDAAPVRLSARAEVELPDRPPVLCAGCPHRGAFFAVKQALGNDPAVMCGDIGCYTLGNAHPLDAIDTCLCMGGGITMAQGIASVDRDKKAIAYVGDSTFFASGMPGLANAGYNGHDITVMVLDNATTAMTGNQPHPGTGHTLMGHDNKPLDIEAVLVANGFRRVYHSNPFDRDASVIAVRAALAFEGPSAVIFEGACIQLAKPQPAVVINREVCTGCKRCITAIGCPAINFNASISGPRSRDRGQATVDESLCTGCGLCAQVCPFHAIYADPAVMRRAHASRLLDENPMGVTRLAGAKPVVKPAIAFEEDEPAGQSSELREEDAAEDARAQGDRPAALDELPEGNHSRTSEEAAQDELDGSDELGDSDESFDAPFEEADDVAHDARVGLPDGAAFEAEAPSGFDESHVISGEDVGAKWEGDRADRDDGEAYDDEPSDGSEFDDSDFDGRLDLDYGEDEPDEDEPGEDELDEFDEVADSGALDEEYDEFDAAFDAFKDDPSLYEEGGPRD